MCKAFSCIVTRSGKVYWKAGIDSHDGIAELFKAQDPELLDNKQPPENTFARIEIHPANSNYLNPNRWVFQLDDQITPAWWNQAIYEPKCQAAFRRWKKQIYSRFNLQEARNPIHPFKIKSPRKITKQHIALLREWSSVRDSVWASVGYSVWDSVWDSIRASVRYSVEDTVGDSVRTSVRAYYGSLFIAIKEWNVDKSKPPFNKIHGYPFRSAVKLWKQGLVPSFDGKKWRLHAGKDAHTVWEGEL